MLNKDMLRSIGIDVDEGLLHFSGRENIYEQYICCFPDDTHFFDVSTAFLSKDYGQLLESVHALKGVAGALGMRELYVACGKMTDMLRNGSHDGLEELYAKIKEYTLKYSECIAKMRCE